jgi:hypothetical protein
VAICSCLGLLDISAQQGTTQVICQSEGHRPASEQQTAWHIGYVEILKQNFDAPEVRYTFKEFVDRNSFPTRMCLMSMA